MTSRLYVSIDRSGLTPRYIASPHRHPGAREWIPRDAVRVKPLEWETVGDEFWARDIYGDHYEVEPRDDGCWVVDHPRLYNSIGYVTQEDAKAAAQADFEARIMSALAAPPGAQEEGE